MYQFCEKKCGLYMDVYGTAMKTSDGKYLKEITSQLPP